MALVVTIAGVNRTTIVIEDSIVISQVADGKVSTATLRLLEPSPIAITTGSHLDADKISMVDGATTYYAGYIAHESLDTAEDGSRISSLQCQGFGIALIETLVEFHEFTATADDALIDTLFDTYLAVIDSVTHVAQLDASMDIAFEEMTLAEIMDAICERTDGRWYVDNDLKLHYFADEANDASFDLSDTPDAGDATPSYSYYDHVTEEVDGTQIINLVRVVGADGYTVTRSDAASQASYGSRGIIHADSSLLTTTQMEERGDEILAKNKDPKITYTVKTEQAGLTAGERIGFKCAILDYDSITGADDDLTIRELRILWAIGEPVYELVLGERDDSFVSRASSGESEDRRVVLVPPTPIASRGWGHDLVFAATDEDTVTWVGPSGAHTGEITTSGGIGTYPIRDGTTGNMAAVTYVYFDVAIALEGGKHNLQTDTSVDNTIGAGKILVAVCENHAGEEASVKVFGGDGGLIVGDHIASNSIKTAHIDALQVTAAKVAAAAITATKIAARAVTADKLNIGTNPFNDVGGIYLLGQPINVNKVGATRYWRGSRNETAEYIGAVHFVQGRWRESRAIQTEAAGTNLFHNGGFGHPTDWDNGWIAGGTNPPAVAQATRHTQIYESAAKLTFAGAASRFYQWVTADKAYMDGETIALSAWVKSDTNDVTLLVTADNAVFGAKTGSYVHPGDNRWHRLHFYCTAAFDDGGATTYIAAGITSETNGAIAYVDKFQIDIDKGSSFISGDLGDGYSWAGTAFESNPSRTVSVLVPQAAESLKLLTGESGSVSMWVQMPYASGNARQNYGRIFEYGVYTSGPATTDCFAVYFDADGDAINCVFNRADGEVTTIASAISYAAGDWVHVVVTWTASLLSLYWNGSLVDTSATVPLYANYDYTEWHIGAAADAGANASEIAVCEVATFNDDLTLEEVDLIYNLQHPLADSGSEDAPGIYIIDGKFRISSSSTGSRIEMIPESFTVYNEGNQIIQLDEDGIAILAASAYADMRSYQFVDSNGLVIAKLGGLRDDVDDVVATQLLVPSLASYDSVGDIKVMCPASQFAGAYLRAMHSATVYASAYTECDASNVSRFRVEIDEDDQVLVDDTNTIIYGMIKGNNDLIFESGGAGTNAFRPEKFETATGYIGTASYPWNKMYAKEFNDVGCLIDMRVVETVDGRFVSPIQALKEIRPSGVKSLVHDAIQLDYQTFPKVCIDRAKPLDKDVFEDGELKARKGEVHGYDSISLGALVSTLLAANLEQQEQIESLEARVDTLETLVQDLLA